MGKNNVNYYLLSDENEESREMREKIKILLESKEVSNLLLAAQIMKSAGIPLTLIPFAWVYAYWHRSSEVRKLYQVIFKKFASQSLQQYNKEHWKWKYRTIARESVLQNNLEKICQHEDLNPNVVGSTILGLYEGQKAVRFCLLHPKVEKLPILKLLLEKGNGTSLHLVNLELTSLPEEIGQLQELTELDISGNQLEVLPEGFFQLPKLRRLHYHYTPLNSETLAKIEKYHPKVVAEQWYDKGVRNYYAGEYKISVKNFKECLKFFPEHAEAWNRLGYSYRFLNQHGKSVECYEKSLALDQDNAFAWANLVEAYCQIQKYEEALNICEEKIKNWQKLNHQSTTDYANMWFIKGLALFYLDRHEESMNANDECIKVNNYAGAWYNKACSSAKLNRKEDMFLFLKEAIKLDKEYIKMATKDKDRDFENFYEDPDFKSFLLHIKKH